MLAEFSAKNFMSIKDEARLSLVARPSKDRRETHLVEPQRDEHIRNQRLVRSAAIYGPNAAGKTNLILALSVMRAAVLNSHATSEELQMVPFAFDSEYSSGNSEFEVIFFLDGIRYQYGFSATPQAVADEWLFAWPRGRAQCWFERTGQGFNFGQKLHGPKETWKRATRRDALFLSTAVALNCEQLKPIFDWFRNSLRIALPGDWGQGFSTESCRKNSQSDGISKEEILVFLNKSDISIKNILIEDRQITTAQIPDSLPAPIREELKKELVGKKFPSVSFVHNIGSEQDFELDIGVESNGTQRIFALAGPWLDILNKGAIIFLDELEQSLHPSLVRFLVECFHNPVYNEKGAQLVFTTHNTSILDQDVFRRDQIWFCERNKAQETRLFPLTQFRPRKKYENLERSYLTGRYGALPYLRSSD